MQIRRLRGAIGLALCLVLAACHGSGGDDGGDGEIGDSQDAGAEALFGWWGASDAAGGRRIYGLMPAASAARLFGSAPAGAVAALYTMSEGQRPALAPLSTYTVEGATPTYLVIDGVRRAIESFTDGYEMTLAADSELMGAEMYHFFSRCPGERATGWFDLRGQGCAGGAAGGASVAIDAAGEVHLLAGSMDEGAGAGCATSPTYARFAEGCDAIGEVAAEMRSSALLAQGGVIHALIEARSADAGVHGQIVHRWRGAADSAWEEEAVAPAGSPVREMRLLAAGEAMVAVVGREDGTIALLRRGDEGAWVASPAALAGALLDADAAADGEVALLLAEPAAALRVRGEVVTRFDLPRPVAPGFGGGVRLRADGALHAAWNDAVIGGTVSGVGGEVIDARGIYAVLKDEAWTTYTLGAAAHPRVISGPTGRWRVIYAIGAAAAPALALLEIAGDGSLKSELLAPEGGGVGAHAGAVRIAAAQAADGMIAATSGGDRLYVRLPELLMPRPTQTIRLEIVGEGTVWSEDGRVECSESCAVGVPYGTRLALHAEPKGDASVGISACAAAYVSLDGWCWVDAVGAAAGLGERVVSVSFVPR